MLTYYRQVTDEVFEATDTKMKDIWITATAPNAEECTQLTDEFLLDHKTVRDVGDIHELPRYEHKKGIHYVFLRTATRTQHGKVVTTPLLAVATKDAFLTIAPKETPVIAGALAYAEDYEIPVADRQRLLMATTAAVINQYQELISQTGERILDIKRRLEHHEVDNKDFIRFITIEDNLNEYRSCLRETETLCERLLENDKWQFSGEALEDLDDIRLHIRQLISEVRRHAQTITSIRNAYGTISNNTLNQRMKTLTVFTVLITIPNVFFGMYGMNVALPFQHELWAYAAVASFSLLVILSVYIIAKRLHVF